MGWSFKNNTEEEVNFAKRKKPPSAARKKKVMLDAIHKSGDVHTLLLSVSFRGDQLGKGPD